MLVTTATVGNRCRNEPSDSSASATRISPAPEAGVRPEGAGLAADDGGRIEPRLGEDHRDHRGGRGLAVAAGDGDAVLDAHQLAQHLGARDDRDVARAGGGRPRGCRAARRSRRPPRRRAAAFSATVADVDPRPEAREAAGHLAVAQVRARSPGSRGSAAPRRCPTCRCRRCRRSGSRRCASGTQTSSSLEP